MKAILQSLVCGLLCCSSVVADDFVPTAQTEIVPRESQLELLWNEGDFTEGPTLAEDGPILFTDIGNRILRFDPASHQVTIYREPSGKANGLMFDQRGRLIACEGAAGGNRRLSVTQTNGEVETLADQWEEKKFNSPNDLAIDARGNIYFTDPRYGGDEPREIDFEGVFLVSPQGEVKLATRNVQRPNGILVSLDGKQVFLADNHSDPKKNHHLLAFDIAADGTLTDKQLLFDIGPDRRGIDGMTLDQKGNIYATAGTGDLAGIYVFSSSGKQLAFIPTPGDPTNCVFDGGSTLYITAQGPKPETGPRKFALYRIKLAIPGAHVFPRDLQSSRKIVPTANDIRSLSSHVFPEDQREELSQILRQKLTEKLLEANRKSSQEWKSVKTREDWETLRKEKLAALKSSLGRFPDPPEKLHQRVTGTIEGNGYQIQNIVFQSRPGIWVTANLYRPSELKQSMPGLILVHAHHTSKEHSELQDMGITWARAGCLVLVPDQLGHGERGQHGFRTANSYPKEFRPSRQDYYFRYDSSLQLYLAGETLMGWMTWDLGRCVDLLLAQKGIDPQKVILLGSVAGGGDPCAVAAALDERITAAVPFNFGGPQPETRFPLPEDAELRFNYAGSGSWESTRNLYLSAKDGFLPWVIVGSIAPRPLVYGHEFRWDQERDPVWKRFLSIYDFYNQRNHLASVSGAGTVTSSEPGNTHCTHIGRLHRSGFDPRFEEWFGIQATFPKNVSYHSAQELKCWTEDALKECLPQPLHEVLQSLVSERLNESAHRIAELSSHEQRKVYQQSLTRLLGETKPEVPLATIPRIETIPGAKVHYLSLHPQQGMPLPLILLLPNVANTETPVPVVLGLAQEGKEGFLKLRSQEIAELLQMGYAVCLPDLSGTGETRADNSREQFSGETSRSATALMLGEPLLGMRLHDVRTVLTWLRTRSDIESSQIILWGDGLVPVNGGETSFQMPRRIDGRPQESEPLGGVLAILTALFEDVQGIYLRRGLFAFESVLSSPYVAIPHDAILPGLLTVGDLPDFTAALAPLPIILVEPVDEWNRAVDENILREQYAGAIQDYRKVQEVNSLRLLPHGLSPAAWLKSLR